MTKVVNRWYNRHHLLLSKVIKMAVRAAAPPRGVEPFVGSKVLKVAIRASVPSGGIRLFGNNNKNNNKVLKVAKNNNTNTNNHLEGSNFLDNDPDCRLAKS